MAQEAPRYNPANKISNFAVEQPSKPATINVVFKQPEGKKAKPVSYIGGQKLTQRQKPTLKKVIGGYFGYSMAKRPKKDQLKVLKLQNMLDKQRLLNQIEKFKIQKKVQTLRRKGQLPQLMSIPLVKPTPRLYPAYADQTIKDDIDSIYQDLGHGDKSLWGGEKYYDEDFYNEEYWGNEFDGDALEHLGIRPRPGVSPLLW